MRLAILSGAYRSSRGVFCFARRSNPRSRAKYYISVDPSTAATENLPEGHDTSQSEGKDYLLKSILCVVAAAWKAQLRDQITCAECKVSFSIGLYGVSLLTCFIHSTFDLVNTMDCVTSISASIESRIAQNTRWPFFSSWRSSDFPVSQCTVSLQLACRTFQQYTPKSGQESLVS